MMTKQLSRLPAGRMGPISILFTSFILTLACIGPALADIEGSDTAIEGTDGADTIDIVDPALAAAIANSLSGGKATATAKGVDAKDGDDLVTGNAAVGSMANSSSVHAGAAIFDDTDIGLGGKLNVLKISAETEANSTGIDSGDGADTVITTAPVVVLSSGASGGSGNQLDVTLTKSATVKTEATAKSSATGIDSGAGADNVTANDSITATAISVSGALSVGVVVGDTSDTNRNVKTNMEASAKSEATAIGIETGDDEVENSSEETSPLGIDGLQITYDKTVSTPGSDDTVTATKDITAISNATSGSAAVSVAVQVSGSSISTVKSESKSTSTAISTGNGSDTVTNSGVLTANSSAIAGAVGVDVEIANPAPDSNPTEEKKKKKDDKSKSTTNVTAESKSIGIDAEGEGHSKATSWSAGITDTGIAVDWSITESSVAGDDVIDNRGAIDSDALSISRSDAVSITVSSGGSAESESDSTAKATSVGIFTGGGNDDVINIATIDSTADASASALSVGISAGQSTDTNTDNKLGTKSSTKATAESSAIGIDTEGDASLKTNTGSVSIGTGGLSVAVQWGKESAAGDDIVDNSGAIFVESDAAADSIDGSITIQASGSLESNSSAKATADGIAISTGAGNDTITNSGTLTTLVGADAGAAALSLTVTEAADDGNDDPPPGEKKDKSNVKSEASATTVANAVGIDAEGKAHSTNNEVNVDITGNSLDVSVLVDKTSLAGIDTVANTGDILSTANAASGAVAASIDIMAGGSVSSKADSNSTAKAGGIYTGGEGDTITNDGVIIGAATATSAALSVGVTVAQPETNDDDPNKSILDKLKDKFASTHSTANATSEAETYGIDAEGDEHSKSTSVTTSLSGDGIFVDVSHSNLSVGADDTVTNSGDIGLVSLATSGAGATEIRVQAGGTASSEANAKATAKSTGIETGGGSDIIDNSGLILTDSTATAGAVSVSFSQDGPGAESKAEAKAESETNSVGISADGGNPDKITTSSLSINEHGIDFSFNHSKTAQVGDDTITNTGPVGAIAFSTSGALGAAITIDGAAESDVKSTAKSNATGIDAGGGSDYIDSSGGVLASATSNAGSLGIGVGTKTGEKTKPKVSVKAAATAESKATGIAADSGKDVITDVGFSIDANGLAASFRHETIAAAGDDIVISAGPVTANALSDSGVGAASVAIDGASSANVNAKATSQATGIETGGGNDAVTSDGDVLTGAESFANAVAASVGVKSSDGSKAKSKVDGETTAEATATGISTDGGDSNSLIDVALTIDDSGIAASFEKSSSAASGDDTVISSGSITTGAFAESGLAAVAVTVKGSAAAKADTTAKAEATGINTGGGVDYIDNSAVMDVGAAATAATANVAVTTEGTATSNSGFLGAGTKATSNAVGITSSGSAEDKSLTVDTNIDFEGIGVTVDVVTSKDGITADGADTIINSGDMLVGSLATTAQANVAVSAENKGIALAIGRSEAEATATGIASGNADDFIDNSGTIDAGAVAAGVMGNVSVTNKGLAVAGNSAWDGGTVAKATATGIDADNGESEETSVDVDVNLSTAQVIYTKTKQSASGNDTIINTGDVSASALSGVATGTAAVAVKGAAASVSTSKSEATATAIRGGDGDDGIENHGTLESLATANAATANISVTTKGVAIAADAVWDGGTTAEATAVGIQGDGGNRLESTRLAIGTDEMGFESTNELADGVDTIINYGDVTAGALSNAASLSTAIAVKGAAVGTATSTSKASATAIHAGDGDAVDEVYNAGTLTSTAHADAVAASISLTNAGLAIAADSVWDGGTKAEATARGIDLGAGGETMQNDGDITSSASALVASVAAGVAIKGVAGGSATSTGSADSIAIDASDGDDSDTILNTGTLTSNATSGAAAASVGFTQTGAAITLGAVWDGGTGSTARSRGIDVGNAGDRIENTGQINANALAGAAEASVSVALTGVAGGITTATAESDAAAIDAGQDGGEDTVINDGELNVNSAATALTGGVAVTQSGVSLVANAFWDGGTNSNSSAAGIDTGDGADSIFNTGDINLLNGAATGAGSVSVAVSGVAGASAQATAVSEAIGIDAGDDDAVDWVENSGNISVDTGALAGAASVGVTQAGVSVNWNGGNEANASGRGIFTGLGDDTIINDGDIDVLAGSASGEVNVSVAVSGVAGAISEQGLSYSDATAIDAGEGVHTDTVINTGNLEATATSLGASASVGVTSAGVAATWNGGTLGDANARGIDVGDGADRIENYGDVTANTISGTAAAAVTVAVTGVAVAIATAEAEADSVAIHAGDDDSDDVVISTGNLTADSLSVAASAAIGYTTAGIAGAATPPWDAGTSAEADATGVFLGGGDDSLRSEGEIDAQAIATVSEVVLSVAVEGVAAAITASESEAHAAGIDAGTGDDYVESLNTIRSTAVSNTNSIGFAGTKFGVSATGNDVWDGGISASADAQGITTGDGLDIVINEGNIETTAVAVAPAASVSFNVAGVAAAVGTSSADATATAIDTGNDDDQIDNSGKLTVESDAVAITVNTSFTLAGVTASVNAFDGGTTGTASSTGIDAGQGGDLVINSGDMDIDSTVVAPAVTVALTGIGAAVASSTATAEVSSEGIDGGDGDDRIDNSGNLNIDSFSEAIAVNIAVSGIGLSGAADAVWEGGTTGDATASGIQGGAGDDFITSAAEKLIDAKANANAQSIGVASSGIGFGFSVTQSTANASADGINAGEGNDDVVNESDINSTADAHAISAAVAVTGAGIAASGTPNWDGGTTSNANAAAISLGAGDDQVQNTGTLVSSAISDADAAALSRTFAGAAVSDATATANAFSATITGDAGSDTLINEGSLTAVSDARAHGLNVSLAGTGVAAAGVSSVFNIGTTSNANAAGMTGGDGTDGLRNAEDATITLDADALTHVESVALTLSGISGAGANATANVSGVGLDGGSGDDTLVNDGTITGTADANAIGLALSGALSGAAISSADTESNASMVGLLGADGADTIVNSGSIDIASGATTTAISIGASGLGGSLARAVSTANSGAAGVQGGNGDDTIINSETGVIDVTANSLVNAAGVSFTGFGATGSVAGTEVNTQVTGIDAGFGNDLIMNEGALIVGQGPDGDENWMSVLNTSSFSMGLAGVSSAQSQAYANTMSIGINGVDGDNQISNTGALTVFANAWSRSANSSLTLFGSSGSAGTSGATTTAFGIVGGSGIDTIESLGDLSVFGTSRLTQGGGSSFTLAGSSSDNARLEAFTNSLGIGGFGGADSIITAGNITVDSMSILDVLGAQSATIFGASGTSVNAGATTRATGIFGGDGDDLIDNGADLDIDVASLIRLNGASYTFGGSANAGGTLQAKTYAEGLLGGAGLDQIRNSGVMDVFGSAELRSLGKSSTSIGGASSTTASGAFVGAIGIDGGDDDDIVENSETGDITVTADAKVVTNSMSTAFLGGTTNSITMTGSAVASGLLGGGGNDQVLNYGDLTVASTADLLARGISSATLTGGASSASGTSTASSDAIGMHGGDGDDLVISTGNVDVSATTVASAHNRSTSSASFTSDQIAGSRSVANASAVGMIGGSGDNMLINEGELHVDADSTAYSFAYANGAVISFDGDAQAGANSWAAALAMGFAGEDGNDSVINDGQLFVTATASTAQTLETEIVSYRLQGNSDESDDPIEGIAADTVEEEPVWTDQATQDAYDDGDILYCVGDCVEDPEINSAGNHYLVVVTMDDHDDDPDTPDVEVYSWEQIKGVDDLPGPASQGQYSDGDIVACKSISCREDPSIESSATYWKLVVTSAGDPPVDEYEWVRLDGLTIELSITITEESFPTYAAANANGLDGDGVANVHADTIATAYGVQLGDGNNTVQSRDMVVEAIANTVAHSSSDGDVFGDSKGSSNTTASATAIGIETGAGNDQIWNTGTMAVTAMPSSQASNEVQAGGGICIWFFGWWCAGAGDGVASSTATISAYAAGILAGAGDNTIINDGILQITAVPVVADDLLHDGDTVVRTVGDNTSGPVQWVVFDSTAVGIQTGAGNDVVINSGDIIVEAKDIASGCADADEDCGIVSGNDDTLSAIGVRTGAGDDILVNDGNISAQVFVNGVGSSTLAIDLGLGNDALTLGDQSTVFGSIILGEGDDSLTLIGAPLVAESGSMGFTLPGGSGIDSLFLVGEGIFTATLTGFEHAFKSEFGTYTLPGLESLESLTIDQGELALLTDYTFSPTSQYFTYFEVEGDAGLFSIMGTSILDGAISVERRGDTYVSNGSRWTVLSTTDGVSNAFADITLPVSQPLLSWELEQTANTVDIVVNVEPFETMALNKLHTLVAGNLTTVSDDATGDLNVQLGTMQNMDSGFEVAYASLAPDAYQALTANTISTAHQMTQLLRNHLSDARAVGRHEKSITAAYEPVSLYYDGLMAQAGRVAGGFTMPQTVYQVEDLAFNAPQFEPSSWLTWMSASSGSGDYDLVDGWTQYDHDTSGFSIGLDRILDNNWIVGVSIGLSDTDLDMSEAAADAAIESWSGTLYASRYSERAFIEGGLYMANQSIDATRLVTIDTLERTAESEHDGDTFMAFLSGGYRFDFDRWYVEPYGSLFYIDISEDAFEETGGDSLNLLVARKSADVMIGEIGSKFVRLRQTDNGLLDMHATLAYNHDFSSDDMNIGYAYLGEPDAFFTIPDRNITSGSYVIGAGLAYTRGRSTFGLEYRGQYNSEYTNSIVGARLAFEF